MWRDAFFLTRMDARHLLREASTLVWVFVMPVIFIFFIGSITRTAVGSSDEKDSLAVTANAGAGFLADQLIERLAQRDYRVIRTNTPEERRRYRRRLDIPAGFTDSVLAAKPMKVAFSRVGEDQGTDYDRVRISRAVYSLLADVAMAGREGTAITAESMARLAAEPRTLVIDVKSAGQRLIPPTGFDQSVPGTMVQFTMIVLFTSGAVTLTIERKQGILRRLASAPMSHAAVVMGKWGARMVLGVVQIAFAMLAGTLLFRVSWGPHLPMVVIVLLAYGAVAASLGMLLGNLGRSEGQVIGLGVLAGNLLAALGGCWWPIEVTPLWAQKLAMFLPTGWAMDALHKLVSFGAPPSAVVPHLCLMALTTLAAGYAISRTFRFQ